MLWLRVSFDFLSQKQLISESQNRVRSFLRNQFSEQPAERVSCVATVTHSQTSVEFIGDNWTTQINSYAFNLLMSALIYPLFLGVMLCLYIGCREW